MSVSGTTATITSLPAFEIAKVGTDAVSLDFTKLGKTVDSVKIPATVMDAIAKSETSGLEITLTTGTAAFDADAVEAISEASNGSTITLT